jgi:two-component system response regulator PilR (NtrC family)
METIIILDDEKSIVDLLTMVFAKEGYAVKSFVPSARIMDNLEKEEFDLLITDIRMPQISGMRILKQLRAAKPEVPVIVITAYGSIPQAVEALKEGALDYVVKPFNIDELKIIVQKGLEAKRLKDENVLLKKDLQEIYSFEHMIGKSKVMKEIYTLIEKIGTTDSTVLISGESGTGKELAARAIHFQSRRRNGTFVSLNCAALPENLLESELFGHVRGAFTGAVVDKRGMFEVAQRGALFLDEIGETTPWTQVKILRALQDRKIRRVGGTEEIPIDVRIICATNQDLKKRIEEGKFREELFYRINVISVTMPPLRERIEDIPLLVSHFLQKYCQRMNRRMKRVAPEVIGLFEAYAWPGNVRELENVIERIVAIEDRETITPSCLPGEILHPGQRTEASTGFEPGFNLTAHIDEISKKYLLQALQAAGSNLKKAAELLGLSYRSLRYLIEKYGLKNHHPEPSEERSDEARR